MTDPINPLNPLPFPGALQVADLNPWHKDRVIVRGEGTGKLYLHSFRLHNRSSVSADWAPDINGAHLFNKREMAEHVLAVVQTTLPQEVSFEVVE